MILTIDASPNCSEYNSALCSNAAQIESRDRYSGMKVDYGAKNLALIFVEQFQPAVLASTFDTRTYPPTSVH